MGSLSISTVHELAKQINGSIISYLLKSNKIYLSCSEHAAELGNAVPDKPLLFLKPTSSYVTEGNAIKFPLNCSSLHHEIELGIVIGSKCTRAEPGEVMKHVAGYWYGPRKTLILVMSTNAIRFTALHLT